MNGKGFGDILDQWYNYEQSPVKKSSPPKKRPQEPPREARQAMEDWLSRNPVPNKDAGPPKGPRNTSPDPQKWKVDDIIDLHGYTAREAESKLKAFLHSARLRGYRKVFIIHGKGKHSQEEGVLKHTVKKYLEKCPYTGRTGHPPNKEGGTGVTWVVLR